MLKRFISMTTAILLMASGVSVLGATAANAANISNGVLLGITAPVNGATPVSAITPNAQYTGSIVWNAWGANTTPISTFGTASGYTARVTLTLANGIDNPAARPSTICPISFTAADSASISCSTDPNGVLTVNVNFGVVDNTPPPAPGGGAGAGPAPANPTISGITSSGAIVDATSVVAGAASGSVDLDLRLLPATGSTAASAALQTIQLARSATTVTLTGLTGSTSYRIAIVNRANDFIIGGGTMVVPFTTLAGGSTPSISGPTPEQIAVIQAAVTAALEKAKSTLLTTLKSDKPATLEQYRAADFAVNNDKVAAKVSAQLLRSALADRENAKVIAAFVKLENFIDQASTPATLKKISTKSLVELALIDASNPNKTTVLNALRNSDAASLDSVEKIKAAIAAELAAVQARKDRLAAIKAKVASRNK